MDGRAELARFFRRLSPDIFSGVHYAWVREYQERGSVHYHVLWDESLLSQRGSESTWHARFVGSGRGRREVIGGNLEGHIVQAWVGAVGDKSREFISFQEGGIVQKWEGESGASQYFGSYLGKASQKELPIDAEKCGRWWYVCPDAAPVQEGHGFLTAYDRPYPESVIFDKTRLEWSIVPDAPSFRDPALLRYLASGGYGYVF